MTNKLFRKGALAAIVMGFGLAPAIARAEWKLADEWKNVQRLYVELPAKPSGLGEKLVLVRLLSDQSYPTTSPYRDGGILSVVTTYLVDCEQGREAAYQFDYYAEPMAQGKGTYDSGHSLTLAQQALDRPWAKSTIDNMIQDACHSLGFQAPPGKYFPPLK